MALAAYDYDESRSGGASPYTIAYRIIENRLLHLRRSQRRYRHYISFPDEIPEAMSHVPSPVHGFRAIEIQEAIASLPEREQSICEGLARGDSIAAIARQTGHTWNTVRLSIDGIRRCFAELGMEQWLTTSMEEGSCGVKP